MPSGSAELTPLVQVAADGSRDKNEKQVYKAKKKKEKAKRYEKGVFYGLSREKN